MAKSPTPIQLARVIDQLQSDRQRHLDAIAEIDELFGQHGIKTGTRKRRRGPGRPKGSKKKAKKKVAKKRGRKKGGKKKARKATKKKGRRSFSKTAEQLILDLLKGGKVMTTAEINSRWKQAKRGKTADNTLSKLVSDKKLKRENIKGERGSKYTLAKSGSKKKATKKKITRKKAATKKSGKKTVTKKTSKKEPA